MEKWEYSIARKQFMPMTDDQWKKLCKNMEWSTSGTFQESLEELDIDLRDAGDEGDEEEEEEEEGNHRAPRKKAVMDDFHEAVIEKCADLDRAAVAERFGEAVLQELDMALALLNLAGRFREKFSQVRARRRSRRAPRPLAQRAFTPHPSLLPLFFTHTHARAHAPCILPFAGV